MLSSPQCSLILFIRGERRIPCRMAVLSAQAIVHAGHVRRRAGDMTVVFPQFCILEIERLLLVLKLNSRGLAISVHGESQDRRWHSRSLPLRLQSRGRPRSGICLGYDVDLLNLPRRSQARFNVLSHYHFSDTPYSMHVRMNSACSVLSEEIGVTLPLTSLRSFKVACTRHSPSDL